MIEETAYDKVGRTQKAANKAAKRAEAAVYAADAALIAKAGADAAYRTAFEFKLEMDTEAARVQKLAAEASDDHLKDVEARRLTAREIEQAARTVS
jgi:hypothetical protein